MTFDDHLAAIDHAGKRAEAQTLDALFRRVSGQAPVMWEKIAGYGSYHYRYASGREGDSFRAGFATTRARHSLHLMGLYCDAAAAAASKALLARLGKHTSGASCVYVNKLADVDPGVLEELVQLSWDAMNRMYPSA
ncbi:DUF1801 domain-containing protein [Erythrobacter arachoides]|uniref:DUF1801 domain-containing protein n=1 Tax=Aurantiacibacter arachoides TaxID=1850444 RepID=A0A844ZZZ1_9SPHN|nr:DUF1801 domain-containing protein [Aurantiacibacter arachoides]MXO92782.1 DUF1801 domain-containing protein [Aurantiacibacter arachoides]GGD54530.1 hypothetical protein GCM10011411_13080 [Aurantiacibacter arachoides]